MTRAYTFSTICGWGLTAAVAVLGVAGVVAMFAPNATVLGWPLSQWCMVAFAIIGAFAIANANNAAAAAMHAITRPGPHTGWSAWQNWHWPTLAPALVCSVGFAFASNFSVHLGWQILVAGALHPEALPSTQAVDTAAVFLCFAKPAISWVVEGRKAMDRDDRLAEEAAEEARLAAIRAADKPLRPERRPFVPEVVEGGSQAPGIGHKAAVAAASVTAAAGGSAALPAEAQPLPPRLAEPAIVAGQTFESPEAHARHLLTAKQTERAVARATGLTRYRVSMLAVEMGFKAA